MTVFLLSGNVVLSAIPISTTFEDFPLEEQKKEIKFSTTADSDQQTFLSEKDTFEELEIIVTMPEVFSFDFFGTVQETVQSQLCKLKSATFSAIPRWLLVRHIVI